MRSISIQLFLRSSNFFTIYEGMSATVIIFQDFHLTCKKFTKNAIYIFFIQNYLKKKLQKKLV